MPIGLTTYAGAKTAMAAGVMKPYMNLRNPWVQSGFLKDSAYPDGNIEFVNPVPTDGFEVMRMFPVGYNATGTRPFTQILPSQYRMSSETMISAGFKPVISSEYTDDNSALLLDGRKVENSIAYKNPEATGTALIQNAASLAASAVSLGMQEMIFREIFSDLWIKRDYDTNTGPQGNIITFLNDIVYNPVYQTTDFTTAGTIGSRAISFQEEIFLAAESLTGASGRVPYLFVPRHIFIQLKNIFNELSVSAAHLTSDAARRDLVRFGITSGWFTWGELVVVGLTERSFFKGTDATGDYTRCLLMTPDAIRLGVVGVPAFNSMQIINANFQTSPSNEAMAVNNEEQFADMISSIIGGNVGLDQRMAENGPNPIVLDYLRGRAKTSADTLLNCIGMKLERIGPQQGNQATGGHYLFEAIAWLSVTRWNNSQIKEWRVYDDLLPTSVYNAKDYGDITQLLARAIINSKKTPEPAPTVAPMMTKTTAPKTTVPSSTPEASA